MRSDVRAISLALATVLSLCGGCAGAIGGEGGECQNPAGTPTELHFVNRYASRRLELRWINEACAPVVIGTLEPETYLGQLTLAGDTWEVRDADTEETLFHDRAPSAPQTTLIFPADDARVCSAISKAPVRVNFKNRYADKALSLRWVDFACKEHPAGEIAARDLLTVDTLVGHVFRLRQAGTDVELATLPPIQADTHEIPFPEDSSAPACSDDGTTMATVGFENHYPARRVAVFWVNYQCQEVLVGELGPGESVWQNTFFTHVFRVRDALTHEVLASPPAVTSTTVMVTVP